MSLAELYIDESVPVFGGGPRRRPEESDVLILGVPFDSTSTYRPGSRFAPRAIREAAANIEFYSLRSRVDVEMVKISDVGDVAVSLDVEETLHRVREVVSHLLGYGKPVIILGGEHTITLGGVQALVAARGKPCVLVFDAHLDLRDTYMGLRVCHATVMRRVVELVGHNNIYYVGVRAVSSEEIEYAERRGVKMITPHQLRMMGVREAVHRILNWLARSECTSLYVSVDMDVYDPSQAPGVANPEPEGLEAWCVLDILASVVRTSAKTPTIIDVVEASPPYDLAGVTSVLAAKTVVEAVAALAARKAR